MKPIDYLFCVHSIEEYEGETIEPLDFDYYGLNIITFCNYEYYIEHDCLPEGLSDPSYDLDFLDSLLPEGYLIYQGGYSYCWASKKSKDEIKKELDSIDFCYSYDLQEFLSRCFC